MNLQQLLAQKGSTTTPSNNGGGGTNQAPMNVSDLIAKYQNPTPATSATTAPTTAQPQSFWTKFKGAAKNVAEGVAKSEISTAQGAGQAVLKGTDALGITKDQGNDTFSKNSALTTPQGTAQTAGDIVGTIAPYFTGLGEEETAGKIAETIGGLADKMGLKAESLIPKVATALTKRAAAFTGNTAVGTAQTGSPKEGAIVGAAGEAGNALGSILKGVGKTAAQIFIPKSDAEAGILQSYKANNSLLDRIGTIVSGTGTKSPSTAASSAFDKGIMGTESMMGVQAKRAQSAIWSKVISPALDQAKDPVDMDKFFSDAETSIKSENPELGRQNTLLNALDSVKEDYSGVKTQTVKQLQKLKEGWADFVPEKAYKGQPIAGAYNDVRNTLASQARKYIYNAVPSNVKQAYLDYGNLHGITALGRKAMTGAVKGGTGTSLKNIMEMLTIPIGTVGGQTLYKVGQLGEFTGAAGARTLEDLLNTPTGQGDTSQSESTPPPAPQPTLPQSTQ